MTGGTTSTHGHTTLHTASEAHGTGAGITVHTGVLGVTVRGGITDTTTHGTMEGGMIHGITVMATADGMIHSTDTCIHITADGTEDGTHITTLIITTIT